MVETSTRSLPALLDEHVRPLVADRHVPAVTAVVVREDETALLATGDLRRGSPGAVDAGTAFQIGSLTKTFTALLLAEMAAAGDVGFDDPIDVHLPPEACPRPGSGPPITLIDLATHTSGLPRQPRDFWRRAGLRLTSDPYRRYTRDHLHRATARLRPDRTMPPRYRYSTFGIAILGELLSEAAGTGYPDLLAERVLRPLKMSGTGLVPAAPMATGHRRGRPVPLWTFDAFASAGAVCSTAADLLLYLQAHLRPENLPPTLAKALQDVQQPCRTKSEDDGTSVALAWNHRVVRGRSLLWHTGGTGGFTTFVGFSPTARAAVAVLANSKPIWRDPVLRVGRRLFRAAAFSSP